MKTHMENKCFINNLIITVSLLISQAFVLVLIDNVKISLILFSIVVIVKYVSAMILIKDYLPNIKVDITYTVLVVVIFILHISRLINIEQFNELETMLRTIGFFIGMSFIYYLYYYKEFIEEEKK